MLFKLTLTLCPPSGIRLSDCRARGQEAPARAGPAGMGTCGALLRTCFGSRGEAGVEVTPYPGVEIACTPSLTQAAGVDATLSVFTEVNLSFYPCLPPDSRLRCSKRIPFSFPLHRSITVATPWDRTKTVRERMWKIAPGVGG